MRALALSSLLGLVGVVHGKNIGKWGPLIDFPLVPVSAAVLPETGELLVWAASARNDYGYGTGQTYSATLNLTSGQVSEKLISGNHHDMFCPGISLGFDGELVVAGGSDDKAVSIFRNGNWVESPKMNIGRGYQSQVTLSDGRMFTLGGSWFDGENATDNKVGEIFDLRSGQWSVLRESSAKPILTNDALGLYRADNHAWLFAWSNNAVFHAGPSKAMHWININRNGRTEKINTRANDPDSMCGNAVMYDAGKIFTAGGSPDYEGSPSSSNVHVITLRGSAGPVKVEKTQSMRYPRIFANSVVLPDGNVLVTGGQTFGRVWSDENSTRTPELWNSRTRTFTTMADEAEPRTYHSLSLLLPDATVFSAGGGLCYTCSVNHYNGQIFSPPYLFNSDGSSARRPVVRSVSSKVVALGGSVQVATDARNPEFSIIRLGTVTHSLNTDQRRIRLEFSRGYGNQYNLGIPRDPGVVVPGYWFLFVLERGVPSIAQTIKITP